jgi:amino acid adenylation domain-containing protein
MVARLNDTLVPYDLGTCLHQRIEAQAGRTPDAVAVVFEGEQLTYRDLEERADRLAQHLIRNLGVGPEVLVGICMERSVEMVVGLLGILKAGGAYVPLDPDYPRERLGYMLSDSRAPVLLTQARLRNDLEDRAAQVLCLDSDWRQLTKGEVQERPTQRVTAENLAYVIYTSGSTGRPKGVMNTHRGICNRLLWMQDEYQLTAEDTVLQKTPFSFDVSVWEFFWPLLTGARLVLARPGGHRDSAYLAQLIADQRVTVVHFVPSMLQLFLDEPGLEKQCRSLRHVICSGEALPFDLQQRFFSRFEAQLHNLYGPTEAAVDVTYWPCQRQSTENVVPIGRPVANTQIYVLDAQNAPVPVGSEGELHIGGVQVARGYWNRPELTAERFIPDPFSREAGARLYKTGDLARYRPDGALEFLGRIDYQVKVRGLRVELGEIEAVLEGNPAVKQACVLARTDEPGQPRLVAYLVPAANETPSTSDLRQYLQVKLPDYMIPSAFVVLEAMPLTPNGKVDRAALPAPDRKRPVLDQAYVEPRDTLERFLAAQWCEVLKLDEVGIHDRFFELGGTSLQAARFINSLQRELSEFIYVTTIFESPSIAAYAALLRKDYGAAVERRFGGAANPIPRTRSTVAEEQKITVATIAQMRECIPALPRGGREVEAGTPKNPPAIFILAPPRSGTTLLRVMLAGHPRLFAAAELQLLGFNSLDERRRAFSGKFSLWLEGTVRALMEIKGCGADEAWRIMETYESQGCTTKRFYRVLQDWLGSRILVDKSPSYVLDLATLEKAERDFEGALYIHLIRHPYAMVRSFERYHMDQVLFLEKNSFSGRELGELVWVISHQNTVDFLRNVPEDRQFTMRFEDLVERPRDLMDQMCATLGLEFHPGLLEPYADLDTKMTDGIHPDSTPMGDTKFLERRGIDPKVAEDSRRVATDNFLSDITWTLASSLGYPVPAPAEERPDTMGGGRVRSRQRELLRRRKELRGDTAGEKAGDHE